MIKIIRLYMCIPNNKMSSKSYFFTFFDILELKIILFMLFAL
jgi:hypothetical protein